nr:hypothetical protein [Tanacetum cinerariifolium]
MANFNNPFNYPVFHQDQPSSSTYMQQPQSNNNYNPQPSFNQNYMQQPMLNPKDITDLTTVMNTILVLMAKAFKLNYSTPTNNNQRISSNPCNRQIAQPAMNIGQDRQMQMVRGNGGDQFRQLIVVPRIANQDPNRNGNELYNQTKEKGCCLSSDSAADCSKEEARIQLQAEEFDLVAAVMDLDEIEEVNANCILMANLQQALTSGTHTGKAPVYDSDGSAEVHNYHNCYDNEILNMFTQEEWYNELLEPIPKLHQVQQNDSNVIFKVSSIEQDGEQ